MTRYVDTDGTPLVRDRTGELVPDPDQIQAPAADTRAAAIARCRDAARRAKEAHMNDLTYREALAMAARVRELPAADDDAADLLEHIAHELEKYAHERKHHHDRDA